MNPGSVLFWLETAGGLVAGVVLGLIHFGTLAGITSDYLAGRARRAIVLQALRMGVMFLALLGLAWLGARPLLASALGIFIARAVVLRRRGRSP